MSPQKRATIVSSITAFILIITKLSVGLTTGTVVVIASAIDSLLDMVVSLFNFFAIRTAEKPSDEVFNYGRGKMEAIAAVFEGLIITFSGIFIIYTAVQKILFHEPVVGLDASLGVMIFSLILTTGLVIYLNNVAKQTGSLVIQSDALHYKSDLFSNFGIIISLIVIQLSGLDIIDPLISIAIAIYIIYSAYGILQDGFFMLMDKAMDEETVEQIKEIIKTSSSKISSYHFLKTRRSGNYAFVDVHLVFNDQILLKDAHNAGDKVEEKIRKIDSNLHWVVTMHLDPWDDSTGNEAHVH